MDMLTTGAVARLRRPAAPDGAAPAQRAHDLERSLLQRELGDRFEIVRRLGRGGMGSVYLARERDLHRHVAIKVLRGDLVGREDARERFRREARLGAQLEHPGIVPVYAFGETARAVYIVMRFVSGESLGERLRREHHVAPEAARAILAQLADALEYAHAHGVVHRDLTPGNVLLDRETGRAMLADFGVARRRTWDPHSSELRRAFGTPHFMSPEQTLGEADLDGRSDIYGLGVLAFLMLTGRVPFDGDTFEAVAAGHLTAVAPRLSAPGVSRAFADVVGRCLEKDPARRWRRAGDLALVLADVGLPWWCRLVRGSGIRRGAGYMRR